MTSKYGFLARPELAARAEVKSRSAEEAARDAVEDQQAKAARAAERLLAETKAVLASTLAWHGPLIADILEEYAQVEFDVAPSVRSVTTPPNHHVWYLWSGQVPLLEMQLLIQGDPPEAGLFVGFPVVGEQPNLGRLLTVLWQRTGVVARLSGRRNSLDQIVGPLVTQLNRTPTLGLREAIAADGERLDIGYAAGAVLYDMARAVGGTSGIAALRTMSRTDPDQRKTLAALLKIPEAELDPRWRDAALGRTAGPVTATTESKPVKKKPTPDRERKSGAQRSGTHRRSGS